jgi:N-methylhydantoinase B
MEFAVPLRMVRWERVPDTGGAGVQRGGCGVAREWEALDDDVHATLMTERARVPAWGLSGGRAGGCGRYGINAGTPDEQLLPSKTAPVELGRGDRFLMQSAGGGGRGLPWQRPADRVLEDVLDGYVSRAAARSEYGVVITEDDEVDEEQTRAERERMRLAAPTAVPGEIDRGVIGYAEVEG